MLTECRRFSSSDALLPRMVNRTFRFTLRHVVACIVFIKLMAFVLDGTACVFMGDSASYLLTAATGWAPDDRSYTYGLWLGFLTHLVHSLRWVVLCQTVLSALAASTVCLILHRLLSIRLRIAAVCGLLCCIEPLQLLSERFILTEAPSTFLFAILVTLALSYLRAAALWILWMIPMVGVLLVSIRVSYLPVVLITVLLPLLSLKGGVRNDSRESKRLRLLPVTHLALLACLTGVALGGYARWYGEAVKGPPSFNEEDGFFLISAVAPIVQGTDFEDALLGGRVLSATKFDLRDGIFRTAHHFASGGLSAALIGSVALPDARKGRLQANAIARVAAFHAMRNHPLRFGRLLCTNVRDYFNLQDLRAAVAVDEFRNMPINEPDQRLLKRFNSYMTRQPAPGLVMNWHSHATWWYMFLIVFPVIPTGVLFLSEVRHRRSLLLLTLYAWSQWIVFTVFVEHDTPRFETGLAWIFFPIAGVVWAEFSELFAMYKLRL